MKEEPERGADQAVACPWEPSPERVVPAGDEVSVWYAPLDLPSSRLPDLAETLSAEERGRAGRFHFERDRSRYVAAHGHLRAVLGRCLGVAPVQIEFRCGPYGRPELAGACADAGLSFNMSHSYAVALYAVARGRRVGVDVERVRPDFACLGTARRFFSPREVAALEALPADRRVEAFFNCWTRKEAYVKARGMGLSMRLDSFDVSLAPGQPAALLRTAHDPADAVRWSLRALAPAAGYVGAVVALGRDWRLRCWSWAA